MQKSQFENVTVSKMTFREISRLYSTDSSHCEMFTQMATLLGAQHYKASTGFSSPNAYRTTNFATLAKINKSEKKSDNNQCLYSPEDRMED